ncbi:hypothetical protein ACFL4F_03065 [Candidatus Margulisiibacteriota bacterium]
MNMPGRIQFHKPLELHAVPTNGISTISKAFKLLGEGAATKEAAVRLEQNPNLLVTYFSYDYEYAPVCCNFADDYAVYEDKDEVIELAGREAKVLAYRTRKYLGGERVYYFTPEEADASLRIDKSLTLPDDPNAPKIIDIAWQVQVSEDRIEPKHFGTREEESNKPIFRSSNPFDVYKWLFRMSLSFDLSKMRGVDLGSGTGTFGFVASHFFPEFTCIEIYNPLFMSSVNTEKKLGSRGSLGRPLNILFADFLGREFDISRFDFVHLYKPILDNKEKLVEKLRGLTSGSLILAHWFAREIQKSGDFTDITPPETFDAEDDTALFKRT